jgi:hypothetical protein
MFLYTLRGSKYLRCVIPNLIGDLNASFDLYFAQYILSRWSEAHQPQLVKCLSV